MIYEIYLKEQRDMFTFIQCDNPRVAVYKVFRCKESDLEIQKVEEKEANIYVKGLGGKKVTHNYFFVAPNVIKTVKKNQKKGKDDSFIGYSPECTVKELEESERYFRNKKVNGGFLRKILSRNS